MNIFQFGDILFQDIGCGAVCDAINGVTPGFRNAEINHCGMVFSQDGEWHVLEAISPKVRSTNLESFLNRTLDQRSRPRIMVGRVSTALSHLIPGAIDFCLGRVGIQYDPLYYPDDKGFYCSELIVDGFTFSNANQPVFPEYPMSFRDPVTGEILDFWKKYYAYFNVPVPDGVPGSNPGRLSLDPNIEIIMQLGDLRGSPLQN